MVPFLEESDVEVYAVVLLPVLIVYTLMGLLPFMLGHAAAEELIAKILLNVMIQRTIDITLLIVFFITKILLKIESNNIVADVSLWMWPVS